MKQSDVILVQMLAPQLDTDIRLRFHTFTQSKNIYDHQVKECPRCKLIDLIKEFKNTYY